MLTESATARVDIPAVVASIAAEHVKPQAENVAGEEAGATWNRARETGKPENRMVQDTSVVRGDAEWLAFTSTSNQSFTLVNRLLAKGVRVERWLEPVEVPDPTTTACDQARRASKTTWSASKTRRPPNEPVRWVTTR